MRNYEDETLSMPPMMPTREAARWMELQEEGVSQEVAGKMLLPPRERLSQNVTRGRLLQQGGLAQEVGGESTMQQEIQHQIYLQQFPGSNLPATRMMIAGAENSLDFRRLKKPWPQGLYSRPDNDANRPPMPSSFRPKMESKPYHLPHPVQNSLQLPNLKPSQPNVNTTKAKASIVTGPWFCSLCKLSATSKQSLEDHFQGKKHKNKAAKPVTKRIGVGLPPPENITVSTFADKSMLCIDSLAPVPINKVQKMIPSQIHEEVYNGGSLACKEMVQSKMDVTKHELYIQDFSGNMQVNVTDDMKKTNSSNSVKVQHEWGLDRVDICSHTPKNAVSVKSSTWNINAQAHKNSSTIVESIHTYRQRKQNNVDDMIQSQIGRREHEVCVEALGRRNHDFYFEESDMKERLHCEESKPKFFDPLLPKNDEYLVHAVQDEGKVLFPIQKGEKIYSQKLEKKNERQKLDKKNDKKRMEDDHLGKLDTFLDIKEVDHFPTNRSLDNESAEVFTSKLTGSEQAFESSQVAKEKPAGSLRRRRGKAISGIDEQKVLENDCKEISRNEVGCLNNEGLEMSKPAEKEQQAVRKQQTEKNADVVQEPDCQNQEEKLKTKVIKFKITKGGEMTKSTRRKLVIPEEENEENIAEIAKAKPANSKANKKSMPKKEKQVDSEKKKRPARRKLVDLEEEEEEDEDNAIRAPLMQENKGRPKVMKLKLAGQKKEQEQEQICMNEYNETIVGHCNEEITGLKWFEEDFAGLEQENLEMPQNLIDKARMMKEELFGSDQEEDDHSKDFVPLMKKRKAIAVNSVQVADENHSYPQEQVMEIEEELHGAVQDPVQVAAEEGEKTVVFKTLNGTNRVKTKLKIKPSSRKPKDATNVR